MAKSQETIEKEKERLCAVKVVGQADVCPTCKKAKDYYYLLITHKRDENGDVQLLLIPEILSGELWEVCDCGSLNCHVFDLDKFTKMWYN
jgi:hypothetical protein